MVLSLVKLYGLVIPLVVTHFFLLVATAKSFVAYYMPLPNRLIKIFAKLSESIGRIGQLQILRLNLTYELCMASKFQARQLSSALSALNG